MTSGQWRVTVLLIVLLALEMIVHPGIHTWLQSALSGFNTALGSK
jgi:hypothetical protein